MGKTQCVILNFQFKGPIDCGLDIRSRADLNLLPVNFVSESERDFQFQSDCAHFGIILTVLISVTNIKSMQQSPFHLNNYY